ncbi:hypothetical protein KJ854_01815, partial [Patescibacteria group bacterium]|nr:hypothetical protein [Patescibacteria group bacterium]
MKKKNILSKTNLIIAAVFVLALGVIAVSGGFALAQYGGGYTPPSVSPTITGISVVINGGASTTDTAETVLTLGATNAVMMAISNNADFSGGVWETYATSKSWTLTSGEGTKTVYVKFRDSSSISSAPVFDTIILNKNASAPDNTDKPSNTLSSYPDGMLIKLSDDPKVYVIKNGNKFWITSEEAFSAAGYK